MDTRKFIHACELGGSIYGKVKDQKINGAGKKVLHEEDRDDLRTSCTRFYQKQLNMMQQVYKHKNNINN